MHPPYNALTVILFGFAALFLLYAGTSWAGLGKDDRRADEPAKLSVGAFRQTAAITSAALIALGVACGWLALIALAG